MIDSQGHARLQGGLEVYPREHAHVRFRPASFVSWRHQSFQSGRLRSERLRFSCPSAPIPLADGRIPLRGNVLHRIGIYLRAPTLDMFDCGLLETDRYTFSATGTNLGEIIYRNGFPPYGNSHNPNRQAISRTNLVGQLSESGLTLDVSADLHGFDTQYLDKLRTYYGTEVEPLTRFVLRATLPWPLILVRQFQFSRHAERFGGSVWSAGSEPQPDGAR